MLPATEQLRLMQDTARISSPMCDIECNPEHLSPLLRLLTYPEPFTQAIEQVLPNLDFCQGQPYLRRAIPIVNFDPAKDGLQEYIEALLRNSETFISPIMDRRTKIEAAKKMFHVGMKLSEKTTQMTKWTGKFYGVAFVMPAHIRIDEGEHISFSELTVKEHPLYSDIWRPPMPNTVRSHEATNYGRKKEQFATTKYYFNVTDNPLGSDHIKNFPVSYTQYEVEQTLY